MSCVFRLGLIAIVIGFSSASFAGISEHEHETVLEIARQMNQAKDLLDISELLKFYLPQSEIEEIHLLANEYGNEKVPKVSVPDRGAFQFEKDKAVLKITAISLSEAKFKVNGHILDFARAKSFRERMKMITDALP